MPLKAKTSIPLKKIAPGIRTSMPMMKAVKKVAPRKFKTSMPLKAKRVMPLKVKKMPKRGKLV